MRDPTEESETHCRLLDDLEQTVQEWSNEFSRRADATCPGQEESGALRKVVVVIQLAHT